MTRKHTPPDPGPADAERPAVLALQTGLRDLIAKEAAKIAATAPDSAAGNVEALHQHRIAIRRTRTLLRAFEKDLPGSRRLISALGDINRKLGRLRDIDIWIDFLRRTERRRLVKMSPDWRRLVQQAQDSRRRRLPYARRCLESRRFRDVLEALAALVKVEVAVQEKAATRSFASVAVTRLLKKLHQARAERDWLRHPGRKIVHQARRRHRLARYLAELFTPALGPAAARLARRLRAVERQLGRAHDMDCAEMLLKDFPGELCDLEQAIRSDRKASIKRATEVAQRTPWRKLEKKLKRSTGTGS